MTSLVSLDRSGNSGHLLESHSFFYHEMQSEMLHQPCPPQEESEAATEKLLLSLHQKVKNKFIL